MCFSPTLQEDCPQKRGLSASTSARRSLLGISSGNSRPQITSRWMCWSRLGGNSSAAKRHGFGLCLRKASARCTDRFGGSPKRWACPKVCVVQRCDLPTCSGAAKCTETCRVDLSWWCGGGEHRVCFRYNKFDLRWNWSGPRDAENSWPGSLQTSEALHPTGPASAAVGPGTAGKGWYLMVRDVGDVDVTLEREKNVICWQELMFNMNHCSTRCCQRHTVTQMSCCPIGSILRPLVCRPLYLHWSSVCKLGSSMERRICRRSCGWLIQSWFWILLNSLKTCPCYWRPCQFVLVSLKPVHL